MKILGKAANGGGEVPILGLTVFRECELVVG